MNIEAASVSHDPLQAVDRAPPSRRSELESAAQEFEAYILKMMLQQLRSTEGSGGLFGGDSDASEGYRAMADDALARRAAEAGSFGLAKQMLEQWDARP